MRVHSWLLPMWLAACGGEADGPIDEDKGEPEPECGGATLAVSDGCIDPGLRPEDCGEGFVHDGDRGCKPVLPAAPCEPGLMAVPGDTACRPVMPCGSGTWGDIPRDATTQHVDIAYVEGDGDGSEARPWTTIQEAVTAAEPGAVIAVAAGSYAGPVTLAKTVQLHGVCPSETHIVGPGAATALAFLQGADGVVVRGVSITGAMFGIGIPGGTDIRLEALHLHNLVGHAVSITNQFGDTSVQLVDSLVETAIGGGVIGFGAEMVIERSLLRDVVAAEGLGPGAIVAGNDGISAPTPASVMVRHSVLERGVIAVLGSGSSTIVSDSVVRDMQPDSQGLWGEGIRGVDDGSEVPSLVVRRSVVERTFGAAITALGADADIEAVTIRDVRPPLATPPGGPSLLLASGVIVQDAIDTGLPGSLTLQRSLVAGMPNLGVFVLGADARVSDTVVRDITDNDNPIARGIQVQRNHITGSGASALVERSLIERVHSVGLGVHDADLTLGESLLRDTRTLVGGSDGDAISVVRSTDALPARVSHSRIADNARAGIASFGAEVTMNGVSLLCQPIHLNGERKEGADASFSDLGGNLCGCGDAAEVCKVLSTNIAPPPAIE